MEIKKEELLFLSGAKNTCRLGQLVPEPGNCVLYYLKEGPDRAFVQDELKHIPEDAQVPS